jgi:hypothetical protein
MLPVFGICFLSVTNGLRFPSTLRLDFLYSIGSTAAVLLLEFSINYSKICVKHVKNFDIPLICCENSLILFKRRRKRINKTVQNVTGNSISQTKSKAGKEPKIEPLCN